MLFLKSLSLLLLLLLSTFASAQDGLVDPADYNNVKIKLKAGKIVKFDIDSSNMLSKNVKASDVREFLEKCQEAYPLKSVDSNSQITLFLRNNGDSITQSSVFSTNIKEDKAFIDCIQRRFEIQIRKTNGTEK